MKKRSEIQGLRRFVVRGNALCRPRGPRVDPREESSRSRFGKIGNIGEIEPLTGPDLKPIQISGLREMTSTQDY